MDHQFGSSQPGFARAFFNGRSDSTPTTGLRLLQREYMHDVAVVNAYGVQIDSSVYRTGTPVKIEYGSTNGGGNIDTFYGYINHMEPTFESGEKFRKRVTPIVCVGPSWIMKRPLQRSFIGRTASSIVRELAELNKFTTDVDESDIIWESLASPGQSEWEFLTMLAKRMGYSLSCHKTEIRCVDQLVQLRRKGGATATFVGPDSGGSTNIKEFKVVSGETTPDGGERAVRVGYGVDPRTGQFISARNDMSEFHKDQLGRESLTPVFEKIMKDMVLTDPLNARERLSAEARINRFHIQAKATVLGNVKVTQGTVVAVVGVSDRNSGYWYVTDVEHCLDYNHYEMHLTLGRDSTGQVGDEVTVSGRRVMRERLDPFDTRVQVSPPTLLIGGQWRSAYAAKKQAV